MTKPSLSTVKSLFAVSGNVCAFQECNQALVDFKHNVVIAEVCHIKAASPGGPRYDPAQSDKERHGFDNLMLMCGAHHTVIDARASEFPVDRLVEMKQLHERGRTKTRKKLEDDAARQMIEGSVISGSVMQTINQSGGQVAHTIFNTPQVTTQPKLIPELHTIEPHLAGQAHAFCIHIGNRGSGTADEVEVEVRHNEVALPRLNGDFWTMGPSHAPYTFHSKRSINPGRDEIVFQVGFQASPDQFVFELRIWARNYSPSEHRIVFTREESVPRDSNGNRVRKYG